MLSQDALGVIEEELVRAEVARSAGNEGLARVCARRAAGTALRAYLAYAMPSGRPVPASSYDLLLLAQNLDLFPLTVRSAASNLLLRVDENHALPAQIDLLQEARNIIAELEQLA